MGAGGLPEGPDEQAAVDVERAERDPSLTSPRHRNGGPPTLLEVEGSEDALVRRFLEAFDAEGITPGDAPEEAA